MRWQIRYGLGGGFGEDGEWEDCDAKNREEAESLAYDHACEVYDSYDGLHGLRNVEMIMEEEDVDAEEAEEIWREEREGWLDYESRSVK
jgi:hypothetical protein